MEAREATATGESCMRVDAIAKVTGRARYTDDYVMAGMCYAKYVRSPIAHGYAASINCDQAKNLPGVLVLTKNRMCWKDQWQHSYQQSRRYSSGSVSQS